MIDLSEYIRTLKTMKESPSLKLILILILSLLFLLNTHFAMAQDVGGKTLISQFRSTKVNIGNADMTIEYHSPNVNGRKIFGGIVPFNFIVAGVEYPWRAGSNQRTTIEFSHDVKINGNTLKAGSYGFLALVSEKEWVLIFSSGKSWGAFNYDKNNDVLRIPVNVEVSPFQEWLSYEFENPRSESVEVVLTWERTRVKFKIETSATDNILSNLEKKEDKKVEDYRKMAIWTLDKDPSKIGEAIELLKKSLDYLPEDNEVMRRVHEFQSKILMADLLIEYGNSKEGKRLKTEMLDKAEGYDIYYYALRKYSVENKKEEAKQILEDQTKAKPDNFKNHIAFGEYYLMEKNQEKAVEHFKRAYEMAESQSSNWTNYARYLYLQNKLVLERE